MTKGITGILRPNGELLSCNYGSHGVITKSIPIEEELECIYLSSGLELNNDELSLIYFNDNITREQLDWFFKNLNKLDDIQYLLWTSYINKKIHD